MSQELKIRGYGSVGRAPRSQRGGQRFESAYLHHKRNSNLIQFVSVVVPFILLKTGKNSVKTAKIARFFRITIEKARELTLQTAIKQGIVHGLLFPSR